MAQLTEPIRTGRLRLRRFDEADLDALCELHARADIARYLYNEPRTRDEVASLLEARLARGAGVSDSEENRIHVGVELAASGRLVGEFMLRWVPDRHRRGEVGGLLHPDVQRQGLATECYDALLVLGFGTFALHRIEARCDSRNVASRRSLERVGFTLEGHLRENGLVKGEWTDELVYGMLASEWRERAGAAPGPRGEPPVP